MKASIVRSSSSPCIWPWAIADPRLGDDRLDQVGDGRDVVDAVVDEIDLAVAVELAVDGPLDDFAVEPGDAGLDRLAVGRRGLEVGDVADSQQAHVQGAGNRRGREGQDVDGRPERSSATPCPRRRTAAPRR